jgi:hypothetical protein
MSDFDIKNYVLLNDEQHSITTSKHPVRIENTILDNYVFWGREHIMSNPNNSLIDSYNKNPKKARVTRLNKILSQLKDKIETTRLIPENRPTLFKMYVSDYTPKGKQQQDIYCEMLDIEIRGENITQYIISEATFLDHTSYL